MGKIDNLNQNSELNNLDTIKEESNEVSEISRLSKEIYVGSKSYFQKKTFESEFNLLSLSPSPQIKSQFTDEDWMSLH